MAGFSIDLESLGMLFVTVLTSWRYLGSVWATCGRPLAPQGGPWELQGPFLMNFGGPSGSLGAPFVHQDRVLDPCFSVSVFGTVSGTDFYGFVVFQACPGT